MSVNDIIFASFDFNPRSHEGSDICFCEASEPETISIHAPTRGATVTIGSIVYCGSISIHAPTRGATLTPRKRSRRNTISIHAPTRGATGSAGGADTSGAISIHAPTRGATGTRSTKTVYLFNFNPRSHEGSDTDTHCPRITTENFNPRSHEGSDKLYHNSHNKAVISIHAPMRGATSMSLTQICIRSYFNPRSHEGSDRYPVCPGNMDGDFNPRSHEGSDTMCLTLLQILHNFNPRSHEGSDSSWV